MCVINRRGKRLKLMQPEEQVAQFVQISTKLVIANRENDESAAVDNYVQFEIPPAVEGFQTKPAYNV